MRTSYSQRGSPYLVLEPRLSPLQAQYSTTELASLVISLNLQCSIYLDLLLVIELEH